MENAIARDVREGLTRSPKQLPSKYFYDEEGDKLFQAIMNMPEYYLTNSEYEVFSQQKANILQSIGPEPFNLIEFGAGDGYKTKVLLRYFLEQGAAFKYFPVDISQNILDELLESLRSELPELDAEALNLEYFQAIKHLNAQTEGRNVILFLGSNIGNFTGQQVNSFLGELVTTCKSGDMLLAGVDLQKDPDVILRAYSDPHGITAGFNLNLLRRLNRELGANFVLEQFKHYATYNPENGEARSYLISLKDQDVHLAELDLTVHFDYAEYNHTEISRKYTVSELEALASQNRFEVVEHFYDCKHYFVDTLWKKQ